MHKLGLVWRGGVDFLVDDQLSLKRVKFSDELLEKADGADAESAAQRFDADFAVMTLEISALIRDLLNAFGGMNTESTSVEEIVAKASRSEAEDLAREVEEVVF